MADKTDNEPSHKTEGRTPAQAPALTIKETISCGIIMPISSLDGCSEDHWTEVRTIIKEAIADLPGFEANMVSDSEDVGVILKKIIRNLYNNPIIVCDVSGKNANVMFELGIRLAFDKPAVIIKDDQTSYSFDTGVIEHLEYPRDLRYSKMLIFKERLKEKVLATYNASKGDGNYSTFLRHFAEFEGEYKPGRLGTKKGNVDTYLIENIDLMRYELKKLSMEVKGRKENREVSMVTYPRSIRSSVRSIVLDHVKRYADANDMDLTKLSSVDQIMIAEALIQNPNFLTEASEIAPGINKFHLREEINAVFLNMAMFSDK